MKNHLWILALVAVLGGTPCLAGDEGGGSDVGGNGQTTGPKKAGDEVKGDVGGNGQGTGSDPVSSDEGDVGGNGQGTGGIPGEIGEGDVGGNGQGDGSDSLSHRAFAFYIDAVERVKDHTTQGDVKYASGRLLEFAPLVTVRLSRGLANAAKSTDAHGAAVLDSNANLLVIDVRIFERLLKSEKAKVLTHHLAKVAGVLEETVSDAISAEVR